MSNILSKHQVKRAKSKKTNEGKGAFEVLAQAWDETLGAINFDREIANMIMERAFVELAGEECQRGLF